MSGRDETRLRVNSANVVHEVVDGEVIAIDLTNGSYYSLAGSGPRIWELLVDGAAPGEICATLRGEFADPDDAIETSVRRLLEELQEAGLVVADGAAAESPAPERGDAAPSTPFAPPALERYTDMKDFFLLDPIHEVSPAGWPHAADDAPSEA